MYPGFINVFIMYGQACVNQQVGNNRTENSENDSEEGTQIYCTCR